MASSRFSQGSFEYHTATSFINFIRPEARNTMEQSGYCHVPASTGKVKRF